MSTVSMDKLKFSCDISGTFVETTRMRGNFNLGQNGIVHMIDDVLLPDRGECWAVGVASWLGGVG